MRLSAVRILRESNRIFRTYPLLTSRATGMIKTMIPARRASISEKSQSAPVNCAIMTMTAGILRQNRLVTVLVSSAIRLIMSPVCRASRPVQQLPISRSKRRYRRALRKRTSVRLPSQPPVTDNNSRTARHPTISMTRVRMLPSECRVATSIRLLHTHIEKRDTPA